MMGAWLMDNISGAMSFALAVPHPSSFPLATCLSVSFCFLFSASFTRISSRHLGPRLIVSQATGLMRSQTAATMTATHPISTAFSKGFTKATPPAPSQQRIIFMAAVAVPELSRLRSTTKVLRLVKEPDMQKVDR